jgi:hypothetical protein
VRGMTESLPVRTLWKGGSKGGERRWARPSPPSLLALSSASRGELYWLYEAEVCLMRDDSFSGFLVYDLEGELEGWKGWEGDGRRERRWWLKSEETRERRRAIQPLKGGECESWVNWLMRSQCWSFWGRDSDDWRFEEERSRRRCERGRSSEEGARQKRQGAEEEHPFGGKEEKKGERCPR